MLVPLLKFGFDGREVGGRGDGLETLFSETPPLLLIPVYGVVSTLLLQSFS